MIYLSQYIKIVSFQHVINHKKIINEISYTFVLGLWNPRMSFTLGQQNLNSEKQ